jgi:hypothetical protein
MYGHSPIDDLILYKNNCLISGIFIFIETIDLKVKYIYIKSMHCIVRADTPLCVLKCYCSMELKW